LKILYQFQILNGCAALSAEIQNLLRICFWIPLKIGYGSGNIIQTHYYQDYIAGCK
jgi:long-subunit acyl-CoA synthetase (AMP-forming)